MMRAQIRKWKEAQESKRGLGEKNQNLMIIRHDEKDFGATNDKHKRNIRDDFKALGGNDRETGAPWQK